MYCYCTIFMGNLITIYSKLACSTSENDNCTICLDTFATVCKEKLIVEHFAKALCGYRGLGDKIHTLLRVPMYSRLGWGNETANL